MQKTYEIRNLLEYHFWNRLKMFHGNTADRNNKVDD